MQNEYFFVPYGWGCQHGTEIIPVTAEEYKNQPYRSCGAYFDSYVAALYYTMD